MLAQSALRAPHRQCAVFVWIVRSPGYTLAVAELQFIVISLSAVLSIPLLYSVLCTWMPILWRVRDLNEAGQGALLHVMGDTQPIVGIIKTISSILSIYTVVHAYCLSHTIKTDWSALLYLDVYELYRHSKALFYPFPSSPSNDLGVFVFTPWSTDHSPLVPLFLPDHA
jgi:hypothetical protein